MFCDKRIGQQDKACERIGDPFLLDSAGLFESKEPVLEFAVFASEGMAEFVQDRKSASGRNGCCIDCDHSQLMVVAAIEVTVAQDVALISNLYPESSAHGGLRVQPKWRLIPKPFDEAPRVGGDLP